MDTVVFTGVYKGCPCTQSLCLSEPICPTDMVFLLGIYKSHKRKKVEIEMINKTIDEMMQLVEINARRDEIERYLDNANLTTDELLKVNSAIYNLNTTNWEIQQSTNPHGVNPFEVISFLEVRVAILARAGNEGYADWMRAMFELAIRYSDQAGLSRKFSLFAELVASTKADLSREERSVLFYTRSLKRLAQLTDYWYGEDAARPLWRELLEYVRYHMEDDERVEALNVIQSNAPWFANEYPQHFQL